MGSIPANPNFICRLLRELDVVLTSREYNGLRFALLVLLILIC